MLHSDDAKLVSNVLSLQALPAKTNKTETPKSRHHGGRDHADMGFSWEEKTMKMALLLDSFQKIIHSCALTCMASTPPIRVNWCCVGGFPILSLVGCCDAVFFHQSIEVVSLITSL